VPGPPGGDTNPIPGTGPRIPPSVRRPGRRNGWEPSSSMTGSRSLAMSFRRPIRFPARRRLLLEVLEARDVPTVVLNHVTDTEIFPDRPLFIPVVPSNTPDGPVSVTATTGNTNLTAETVTGGRSVRFDVTGTDSAGVAFSGSITIRLFESEAPL